MSSPDCKRQKLAEDINSVAKMANVSPTKRDDATQTENGTSTGTPSTSKKLTVISSKAQDFEVVAKMDGFVDRTMLIKELLEGKEREEDSYAMMFAPSKFGKTINLDMIRLFCDIEDKNKKTKKDVARDPTMEELRSNPSKNMKVFLRQFGDTKYEECLILKEENFVIQHFGRHPVVSFNFKNCSAKSESEAIFECADQVRINYLKNEYLEDSKEFQSGNLKHNAFLNETCKDWLKYRNAELKSLSLKEVTQGLENLIESLRIHWGRLPVFLVDEVDKPCVIAMQKKLSVDQVHDIGDTITNVICSILKAGQQLTLQAALVTGICKFLHSGLSPLDNTLEVYFLSDERFSKYYGLTADEIESLVRKFNGPQGEAEIGKIISDINKRYNGYYQYSSFGEKTEYARYCLFSVLKYIKKINEDTYDLCFWTDGGFLMGKFVPVLKKSEDIMSNIQKLLYGDSGTITINYQKSVDVHNLLGLYREGIKPNANAVFNFFLQRGYLAGHLEKPIEKVGTNHEIYVRIPNLEVKGIYENLFELYFKSLPNDIQSIFTSCGDIFKSLPTKDSTELQNSLDELCGHLKCLFTFMECTNEITICGHILAILKRDAEYDKGEMQHTVQYFDNNEPRCVYIDVWGRHGNFAVIFEVKFNRGASGERGKAGPKEKSSLAAAEDIVELLPGKEKPESGSARKAGTGRDLKVLSSQIEQYVLIGLAVDGDYTTHMLVFRDTSDWKNVIQVNPEKHVAELISTHLKSKIPVV